MAARASSCRCRWPVEDEESRDALAWRAIVRGIRDYCGKNGFRKVWLGLSGGIDSAMVLALAVDALGAENVTAVRLPSRYTADMSNDLAAEQCAALGVKLEAVSIEKPFAGFLEALAPMFDGKPVDVTEENLQSRSRGVILMALSNKFGGLLLTTGNKSEYAVGYATIYGDMCGGYAPIKDLYKTEVFALARWRNAAGGSAPNGGMVIPPAVIERPPSAELRENQKDQDSLPPYDVLDAILMRHVDLEQSPRRNHRGGFQCGDRRTRACAWCASANGSATRPRRDRRSRAARSVANGATRSRTGYVAETKTAPEGAVVLRAAGPQSSSCSAPDFSPANGLRRRNVDG